jgi:hypothetical protein
MPGLNLMLGVSMTEPPGLVRKLVLASESRSGRPLAPVLIPGWYPGCAGASEVISAR